MFSIYNSYAHGVYVWAYLCAVQVLRKQDLPVLNDWVANPSPLCPFTVDHKLLVEDSGGQTLQVCFASKTLGGDVLRSGCSIEEVRFCIFPEALVVMLIMEAMDSNEAVIVTVCAVQLCYML